MVALFVLAVIAGGIFMTSEPQTVTQITQNEEQLHLLPISPKATPRSQSSLQASAYSHFLNLFGPPTSEVGLNLAEPVSGFKTRITKKSFGIFISPENSPVENDRFLGYHNGVDAEFEDVEGDVPVKAIADGIIIFRDWVSGYGGVIVIKHTIKDISFLALYGHVDPASLPPSTITTVKAGQQIAILGDNHSEETDGVRKHLHFSILPGEELDFHGYVQTEEELGKWLNPLDLF